MKTIIAGSRVIVDNKYNNKFKGLAPDHYYQLVCEAIEASGWALTTVVSGTANGVDQLGEKWAKEHSVAVEKHPADWKRYNKAAGYKRNEEMAQCSEALIAIMPKGNPTKGTAHMINLAKKYDLKVFVYEV